MHNSAVTPRIMGHQNKKAAGKERVTGDNPERRVLRRKKQYLTYTFDLTDKYLNQFVETRIINRSGKQLIQAESLPSGRIGKFVDVFLCDESTFDTFCTILEEDYEGLSHELRAELKAEKGQLEVEDYIAHESNLLVTEMFGNTKRLTAEEKKEILQVVAMQTQCTKEAWRKRYERCRSKLESHISENEIKDAQTEELIEMVGSFVRINQGRLNRLDPECSHQTSFPRKVSLTDEDIENDEEGTVFLELLNEHLEDLFKLTSDSLKLKEDLAAERLRALRILNIDGSEKNDKVKLDLKLRDALSSAIQELQKSREELRQKEETSKHLENELNQLKETTKQEIERKDATFKSLKLSAQKNNEKVREFHEEVTSKKEDMQVIIEEIEKYKAMAEELETNRRLGYQKRGKGKSAEALPPKLPSINSYTKPSVSSTSLIQKGKRHGHAPRAH